MQASIYFHRNQENKELIGSSNENNTLTSKSRQAFSLLYTHFIQAYTNKKVLRWSLWYAMGTCGYLQVITYIQSLWNAIDDRQEVIWNGAVEAIITLSCAIIAFLAGYLQNNFLTKQKGLFILTTLSMVQGGILIFSSYTDSRILAYICYLLFNILYSFLITISGAEIAKNLVEDSFGLVFGINTLLGVAAQSLITFIVTSGQVFVLTIFQQYFIYGILFIILGFIYLILMLFYYIYSKD